MPERDAPPHPEGPPNLDDALCRLLVDPGPLAPASPGRPERDLPALARLRAGGRLDAGPDAFGPTGEVRWEILEPELADPAAWDRLFHARPTPERLVGQLGSPGNPLRAARLARVLASIGPACWTEAWRLVAANDAPIAPSVRLDLLYRFGRLDEVIGAAEAYRVRGLRPLEQEDAMDAAAIFGAAYAERGDALRAYAWLTLAVQTAGALRASARAVRLAAEQRRVLERVAPPASGEAPRRGAVPPVPVRPLAVAAEAWMARGDYRAALRASLDAARPDLAAFLAALLGRPSPGEEPDAREDFAVLASALRDLRRGRADVFPAARVPGAATDPAARDYGRLFEALGRLRGGRGERRVADLLFEEPRSPDRRVLWALLRLEAVVEGVPGIDAGSAAAALREGVERLLAPDVLDLARRLVPRAFALAAALPDPPAGLFLFARARQDQATSTARPSRRSTSS